MKYKLGATIPVVQYGNLMPEVELEGDDINALYSSAMAHISEVWGKYGERPLRAPTVNFDASGGLIEEISFTGERICIDKAHHRYYDTSGKELLSGSKYADSVSPKFDMAAILPKTAKLWGVPEAELSELWSINGDISNNYGSAIHSALDAYHKYKKLGEGVSQKKNLEYNYALPKNKHIRDIVVEFDEKYGIEAICEVLVSDVKNGRVGRIDRLVVDTEKKTVRIGDFKTNNELDDKKVMKYNHQLSFYGSILSAFGWKVDGLDLYHYDGNKWKHIPLDMVAVV